MNTKLLAIAATVALGGPLIAHGESVTYDFTGIGHVYTFTGTDHEFIDLETTFTGAVTFDVHAEGPGGSDFDTDGSTWARDRNGWVQSDFDIRWAGNRFNPMPVPAQYYTDSMTIVFNDDEGVVDRLSNREHYEGATDDISYLSFAELLRSTNDTSWLSDLSFNVTVGLAPPDGDDNAATNHIEFGNVSATAEAVDGFSGYIDLTSFTPRAAIDIQPRRIHPASPAVIPVAILTTAAVDAAKVDPSTVLFGRTGADASPVHWSLNDVDSDGDPDLVMQFVASDTGIQCGDTSASLTGKSFGNQKFSGSDSFVTAPCR